MPSAPYVWTALLVFSVDASSEDMAFAKFFKVVCEQFRVVQKTLGAAVIYPTPTEPQYLYWQHVMGQWTRKKRTDPTLPEPNKRLPLPEEEFLEQSRELSPHEVWIIIRYSAPGGLAVVKTWEQSTRWIWETFEPPVELGVRLVSVEEQPMFNFS